MIQPNFGAQGKRDSAADQAQTSLGLLALLYAPGPETRKICIPDLEPRNHVLVDADTRLG